MTSTLGLMLALAASVPSSNACVVLGERAPALMIIALPKGAVSHASPTDLLAAAAETFRARTGLDLRAAEQAGLVADCDRQTRLRCWTLAARPDYDRSANATAGAPPRPKSAIAAILVINVLPFSEGRDRLTLELIDTERALACERRFAGSEAEAEDCIWESAARSEPAVLETADRAALERFFLERIGAELSPILEAIGELEPFGRIAISSQTAGAELRIDGVLAATLGSGLTTIEEVRPGRRVLGVARPDHRPLSFAVRVERARTATASADLVPLIAGDEGNAPREVLFYAGATTAALGLALGVYAIARASSVDAHCLVPRSMPDAPCASLGQPTFSLSSDSLPTGERDRVNPEGISIPAAALGLGFMGAGWMAGVWALEPDGFPWLETLLGAGAGAAAFAITSAVNPR